MPLGVFQSGVFALDVGGSSVVALHVTGDAGSLKLRACYEWPLPEGLVVDGEIVDGDLFARELRAFVSEHKLRGRAVHLAVSNQKVIVRNIEMAEIAARPSHAWCFERRERMVANIQGSRRAAERR